MLCFPDQWTHWFLADLLFRKMGTFISTLLLAYSQTGTFIASVNRLSRLEREMIFSAPSVQLYIDLCKCRACFRQTLVSTKGQIATAVMPPKSEIRTVHVPEWLIRWNCGFNTQLKHFSLWFNCSHCEYCSHLIPLLPLFDFSLLK
ncbi:hypothetical protein FKM82_011550 [Ascaphus truei]